MDSSFLQHHRRGFKMKTTHIRIRLDTYRRIRYLFPAKRDETAADYFERLAVRLKELKNAY